MDEEIWLPVCGYEGSYEVSNHGRLRSLTGYLHRPVGNILKGSICPKGYIRFCLGKRPSYKKFYLHRLVIRAFQGKLPTGKQVNHIDGNKLNNRNDNLEYVTHLQNIQHARENGLYDNAERRKWKLTPARVREIRSLIASKHTLVEIQGRFDDLSYSTLSKIKRNVIFPNV